MAVQIGLGLTYCRYPTVDGVSRKWAQLSRINMATDIVFLILRLTASKSSYSPVVRKPFFEISDQVKQEADCTTTDDGQRLEISNLIGTGTVLSM